MPDMMSFSHRHNQDGTVDSICRQCFITVATSQCELELASQELRHICNPGLVELYNQDRALQSPTLR
jgi:hypothetical protein